MFYYLVSKSSFESSTRAITPIEAWDTLYAWEGNDFSMSLPDIQSDYICWGYPYNTQSNTRKLYAFSRSLDANELDEL